MADQGRYEEVDRLDANLSTLLKESYPRPEPRADFRNDLLARLKEKQGVVVQRRRRRRRIRRVAFGSAGGLLAASLAIMLTLGGEPGSTASPQQQGELAASAAAQPGWQSRLRGAVEVAAHGETFRPGTEARVALHQPIRARTRDGQGLMEIAPGARLVMDRGSLVRVEDGRVEVEHGLVSLRVEGDAEPIRLRLPRHEISVEPGSWLGVDVKPAAGYAEAGRPAPDVTLLEGAALLADADESCRIEPGRTYRLHPYPSLKAIQGRALDLRRPRHNQSWVQPRLVNFLVPQGPSDD